MFCKKCGAQIEQGTTFCPNCGTNIVNNNQGNITEPANAEKKLINQEIKCTPSFILGLIASILGIFGGFATSIFDFAGGGNAPFFLILGGSVIGLIGACLCRKKALIGSVLELVAAIMIAICAFGISGSGFSSVLAMVLFFISSLIGIIKSVIRIISKK